MIHKNNKAIVKAIKLTWASLDSHLEDTYNPIYEKLKERRAKYYIGDKKFHIKTATEYAEVILTLVKQLK